MRYIPRLLAHTIRRAITTFPAVLVTGARQTGKTTLLRTEFGDAYQYCSLDRPDMRARALADPVAFINEAGSPLLLDEIQYTPELLHYRDLRKALFFRTEI
jgi:predicted AAA+ superfamily ATPase